MTSPPPHRSPGMPSPWRMSLGVLALAAAVLGLAWIDVLPGGWTLRGWVEPHAKREARARHEHSQERLLLFARENEEPQSDSIVFAGSSTMERFPLDELFPGAETLNRGIGDETCEEFYRRVGASRPRGPAAAWVLYLGSLDFRRLNSDPEVVVQRVEAAIGAIRGGRTELPLVLIGILPEQGMSAAMVTRLAQTNAGLAQLCSRLDVDFVDTARAPITGADGSLSPDHAVDALHLNRKGYGVLAGWLLEASPRVAARLQAK
ncbi:MAG: GDSL-type esterase/lipase family protein [Planctomycetota bacterium]|nr:GDSL-type esterase/lipase family protein [Planctomycetota bacterium]